jgi:hypothetical protein
MIMTRRTAFAAGAAVAVALLAACSDSPTAPVASPIALKPNLATGDVTNTIPVAVPGKLIVCKAGNANGTFTFTRTTEGTVVGSSIVTSPQTITTGTCLEVANDDSPSGNGSHITVTEQPAANTTFTIDCRFRGYNLEGTVIQPEVTCNPYTNGGDIFLNHFHGYVLVYTDTFTPPPEVCDFSTFGGFVLLPNNISYGGNAGRIEDGFAYGDLNFVNHTNGDHIHVWNVTDYGHPDTGPLSQFEDSRLAFGMGEINGSGSFPVEFRFYDAGEPAKKEGDMVYLKVNGVVLIPEQAVGGGNIQLHSKCKKAPKAEKH